MNLWKDDKNYLPEEIAEVFEETDIVRAFDYLENVLHISKLWRSDFERQYSNRTIKVSRQEFFIRFTMAFIDPHLSVLTHRKESPTLAMLGFILKDKLDRAKLEKQLGFKTR